jgi:putative DNA primase/helicase
MLIEWNDPDGIAHQAVLRHADLIEGPSESIKRLADAGLRIQGARRLKQALRDLRCQRRVRLVLRTGWHNGVFVLPGKIIGQSRGDEITIYNNCQERANYGEAGTLQQWVDHIAAPASGSSRLILAISVAFAGPVADLLQEEPGGVNLVGPSSIGKSTALHLAGSVWGGRKRNGFVQPWRATDNGLEALAKAHSGTCLILDELGQADPATIGQTAYMLLNGQGKQRANTLGEGRPRAEWRTPILSSGEVGLADKIREGKRSVKQGQLVRIIDVPAEADRTLGLFESTSGLAPGEAKGRVTASLRRCGAHVPGKSCGRSSSAECGACAKLAEITAELSGGACEGQVARVAKKLALVALSGELARVALELPWRQGEAIEAARKCFEAWREERGGDKQGEILAAVQKICSAIEKHGDSRFKRVLSGINTSNSLPTTRDLLGYRLEVDCDVLWAFTRTGLQETLDGCATLRQVINELAKSDYMNFPPSENEEGRYRFPKTIDGCQQKLFAFRQKALFDEGDPVIGFGEDL